MSTNTNSNTNGAHQKWLPEPEWTEEDQRRDDALWDEFVAQVHAGISPGRLRPPSHRDLDVFHEHVIRHRKQRDVAAAFGLKQGQVSRICSKVRRWLGKSTAEEQGLPAGIEGLRSEVNVHLRQLGELLVQATEGYQRSTQDQKITKVKTRRRASGEEEKWEETITKTQNGSVQFLRTVYTISRDILILKTGRVPGCRGPRVLPPDASLVKQRELKQAAQKTLELSRFAHQEHMHWHAERTMYTTPDGKPAPLPPYTKDLITVIGLDGAPMVGTRFSDFNRLGRGTVFQVLDPRVHRPYDTDYKPLSNEELAAAEAAEEELNYQTDPNARDLPKVQPEEYAAILAKLGKGPVAEEQGPEDRGQESEDGKQEPGAGSQEPVSHDDHSPLTPHHSPADMRAHQPCSAHQECSAHQGQEPGDGSQEPVSHDDHSPLTPHHSPADMRAHQACSAHQGQESGAGSQEPVSHDHPSPLTPHHSPADARAHQPCSAHQGCSAHQECSAHLPADPTSVPPRRRRGRRREARRIERERRRQAAAAAATSQTAGNALPTA